MKITGEFTVSVPVERAWEVLTDLEGIAPCMPGAQLTGVQGDTYSGRVKVKVGPVISDFTGTARFAEKDDLAHRAVIDARGKDSRGAGNASAMITAGLRADGDRTVVSVDTDLKISGKVAQFGSGMINQVSEKLLGQFVECLESKLAAEHDESSARAETTESSSAAGAGPSPGTTAASVGAPTPIASAAGSAGAATGGVSEPTTHATAQEPEALDLMQLVGGPVAKRLVLVLLGIIVVAVIVYRILR
jgi:carbon monoxide dehydrogenase subunit G